MLRLRVMLRHRRLDVMLAEGRDPWSSAELMARAVWLGSLEERRRLARALELLLMFVDLRRSPSPHAELRFDVVVDQRDELLELSRRLRELEPIDVAVVARLAILVFDPSSPIFEGGRPASTMAATVRGCADVIRAGR